MPTVGGGCRGVLPGFATAGGVTCSEGTSFFSAYCVYQKDIASVIILRIYVMVHIQIPPLEGQQLPQLLVVSKKVRR